MSLLTHAQGIEQMLADIRTEALYTRDLIGRDAFGARVMSALAKVPREQFVPEALRAAAFDDGPLPIGHGQTISQPYIVALMTDLLATQADHRVLEIGTGSGYQTAVLSLLCRQVYSMDLIPDLTRTAAARLTRLGYHNAELRSGNGYAGWPEHAPYDGIIVTAAATHIPPALVDQLRPGGNLVIPVGPPYLSQDLKVVHKDDHGSVTTRSMLGVAFVPLVDHEQIG
ncbi:MAG: protein-L-isoaspartate(D-aspartate) O-methyltransferase [Chromatiaceae bacterium]|nr:protein-L-isoaspartate(D-aspartate) O-methyltransferase [Chromatiaceae bacterium]